MNMFIEQIINFFFPAKCPFCGDIVEKSAQWCEECSLPWAQELFFVGDDIWCYAPFWYRDSVKDAILRYKFSGLRQYAPCFGHFMADSPLKDLPFDYITWAPLSEKRRKTRGYNQAELLARVVAQDWGVTALDALEKVQDTVAQSSLESHQARRDNAKDVYSLKAVDLRGAKILFVDDVITSGSTVWACEEVLRQGGAAQVVALSFARAGSSSPNSTFSQPRK